MLRRSIDALRGESAVPTLLTLVVSAWFLAAGVAIFADRADARPGVQPTNAASAAGCSTSVVAEAPTLPEARRAGLVLSEAPAARQTIVVEARRKPPVIAEGPAMRETILVEARRG